jgi:hypothetical protein
MRFANRPRTRAAIATVATGAIAAGTLAVVMSASASPAHPAGMHGMMGVHAAVSGTDLARARSWAAAGRRTRPR